MSHPGFRGPSDIHDECWELLPWLANERLGPRETARVEVHLRDCAACREELQMQQRLRQAIREQDAVVLAPQRDTTRERGAVTVVHQAER